MSRQRENRILHSLKHEAELEYDTVSQCSEHFEPVVVIENDHVQMKKTISLFHAVFILLSVTGHVAVFVSPSAIFRFTNSPGIL